MRIESASLQLASTHSSFQYHEVKESLKIWSGLQPPPVDQVTLSDAGQAACLAEPVHDEETDPLENDPRMCLIRSLIELLTGEQARVFDSSVLRQEGHAGSNEQQPASAMPPSTGLGVEYERHDSYSESEESSLVARGTVKTADGREIGFSLELSMNRSYQHETDISVRLGDAARKVDPLVLHFSGTAAQLTEQRFAFDLNADGQSEQINFVAPGSGFLVFDRNQDGLVNDGLELFGPNSGNGFSELATFDEDKNGWVDENDSGFKDLQVWSRNAKGEDALQSLNEVGVGAISLKHVSTPFDLKTSANQTLGTVRSSGVYLNENGEANVIQQIDLTI